MEKTGKTKKCKDCKMDIPVDAKKCPYCQSKQAKGFGWALWAILGALLLVVIFAIGGGENPQTKPSTRQQQSVDSLSKMEIVFEGKYARNAIKIRLDNVMQLYNLELNEENYSRAGSALVALRKKYGVQEMEILDSMINLYAEGVNLSFSDAAGLAVSLIVTQ